MTDNVDYTDAVKALIKEKEDIRGLAINFLSQNYMQQILYTREDLEKLYEYARFIKNDDLALKVITAISSRQ